MVFTAWQVSLERKYGSFIKSAINLNENSAPYSSESRKKTIHEVGSFSYLN